MNRLRLKSMTFLIVLPLSLVGLVVFVFFPLTREIKELGQRLVDARIHEAILLKERQDVSAVTREYNRIQGEAATLSRVFVDGGEALKFVETLESISDAHDVRQDIRLTEPTRPNVAEGRFAVAESTIDVRAEGSFPSLFAYLQALESLPYALPLNSVTFSPSSTPATTEGQPPPLLLLASGKTYWFFSQ